MVAVAVAAQEAPPDVAMARLSIPGRTNANPSVAALGDVVAVAWSAAVTGGASDVYVAVSRDGGARFGAPVQVNDQPGEARNGGEMPPRVALVPRSTLAATAADPDIVPDIVVVWRARNPVTSIRYARSRDGGRTFGPATSVQSPEAKGERGWQTAAVAPDGRVHALWLDHRGLAATSGGGASAHQHHRQDGVAAATPAASASAAFDGVAMAQRSGLYYAAIGDGAPVERELAKGVCYCCKTALAAGPNGALYAAWRHVYEGNIRDIAFVASTDAGRTFGEPTRVSEDRWQLAGCPDDGPAMAIDGRGVAHIVWPTVIGGETPQGAIFYASTRDGRTFTPRLRVPTLGSPKPSHPQLTLAADGRVTIAWDETIDGVRRAAVTTLASVGAAPPAFASATLLDPLAQAAVYPALAATPHHVVAVWASGSGETSGIAVRRLAPTRR
jgi:hypothetical protein